jgi:hypothetical protein
VRIFARGNKSELGGRELRRRLLDEAISDADRLEIEAIFERAERA